MTSVLQKTYISFKITAPKHFVLRLMTIASSYTNINDGDQY